MIGLPGHTQVIAGMALGICLNSRRKRRPLRNPRDSMVLKWTNALLLNMIWNDASLSVKPPGRLTEGQRFVHDNRWWAECSDIVLVSSYYWLISVGKSPGHLRLAIWIKMPVSLMQAIMITGKGAMV